MSNDSKSNFNLINAEIPDCVDNAVTNLTDKPTKAIGDTLSDIWFIVFGGISHYADKRKLRYAAELEKMNLELHKEVSEIPIEKIIEPDIQIVAPALEASKFCVEKEELRKMYVKLIASSLNNEKAPFVHPIFTDIIRKMSSTDAKLFNAIINDDYGDDCIIFGASIESISFSLTILEQLGLIALSKHSNSGELEFKRNVVNQNINTYYTKIIKNINDFLFEFDAIYDNIFNMITDYLVKKNLSGTTFPKHKSVVEFFEKSITVTNLGQRFRKICL